MKTITIKVKNRFNDEPYGRYRSDSDFSGESFREDHLIPSLNGCDKLIIEMDGVLGYPTSFLEEAFGGLVRAGFEPDELLHKIEIHHKLPMYKKTIMGCINACKG